MKKISYINFNKDNNPDLIAKVNKAAVIEERRPHDLVKFLLKRALDEILAKKKEKPVAQSAGAG